MFLAGFIEPTLKHYRFPSELEIFLLEYLLESVSIGLPGTVQGGCRMETARPWTCQ